MKGLVNQQILLQDLHMLLSQVMRTHLIFLKEKIAACAKHFIGDGGTTWETGSLQDGMHTYKIDRGDTRLTEEELRKVHLPPYLEAIKAGVKTIMISFNSWNGVKCHGSKFLINDLLKSELNLKVWLLQIGLALTKSWRYHKSDIITSINAGIDLCNGSRSFVRPKSL